MGRDGVIFSESDAERFGASCDLKPLLWVQNDPSAAAIDFDSRFDVVLERRHRFRG